MQPTEEEIDEVIVACVESEERGRSRWPGMSYEQGVLAALLWADDRSQPHPLED